MNERPVLDQVNLVVKDMEAMTRFYQCLGVQLAPVDAQWADWARHHRNSESGEGTQLDLDSSAFAGQWNQSWSIGRAGVVLGFRVQSREAVDALCAEMTAAGYACEQPPYDAFWGARYSVLTDPDGNAVGVMSPRDLTVSSAPPPLPAG